jgi:hypothetical protein
MEKGILTPSGQDLFKKWKRGKWKMKRSKVHEEGTSSGCGMKNRTVSYNFVFSSVNGWILRVQRAKPTQFLRKLRTS